MLKDADFRKLSLLYPVVNQLTPGQRRAIRLAGRKIMAKTGQLLFDTGMPCENFLFLVSGKVNVYTATRNGRCILLYNILPGETCILSISCLLGHEKYPAQARVEADIVGFTIPEILFDNLISISQVFRGFVFNFISDQLLHLTWLIEDLTWGQLDRRLAAILLNRGVEIHTTHRKLANELGSVREVVSRLLKNFEEQGFVKLSRGHIHIINQKALEEIACLMCD